MAIIHWFQAYSAPWLDFLAIGITWLGTEEFYMVAIPIIYLCIHKPLGMVLATIFLSSHFLNAWAKDTFMTPRPGEVAAPGEIRVLAPETGTGYAFPSGHAQGMTVFWGYLALRFPRPPLILLALFLIVTGSLSRLYLGLHFLVDIIGGLAIALVILAVFRWVEHRTAGTRPVLGVKLALAVLPLVALLVYGGSDGVKVMGYLSGLILGYHLESHYLGYEARAPWWAQVIKAVVAIAGLFALQVATRMIFPEGPWQVVRYGFMALWVTMAAPYLFVLLGLGASRVRSTVTPGSTTASRT